MHTAASSIVMKGWRGNGKTVPAWHMQSASQTQILSHNSPTHRKEKKHYSKIIMCDTYVLPTGESDLLNNAKKKKKKIGHWEEEDGPGGWITQWIKN